MQRVCCVAFVRIKNGSEMTHPYGRNADEVEEKQPPLCAKGRDLLCHANNLSFPAAQSVQSGAPNWLATKSVDSPAQRPLPGARSPHPAPEYWRTPFRKPAAVSVGLNQLLSS